MTIDWDAPIVMSDGTTLCADVFRPDAPGRYPVIMTHGVYGKGLPIERFRHRLQAFRKLLPGHDAGADLDDAFVPGSVNIAADDYRVWEVVDPNIWVPAGYACVRVDSRGSGSSKGRLDPLSPQEIDDYSACIEWAGQQPWSTGKVGLCGKSYYAMSQWLVAARRPKHLAAICVWHGWSDWYRDATRHGGIMYQFWERFWYPELALPVQNGASAGINPHSGLPIAGAQELDAKTLFANRTDLVEDIRTHPFDDDHYYGVRTPALDQIEVPLLASADWSDHDLHLRGTIEGFLSSSSNAKWLEIHEGGQFDDPDAVALQRRFLDHYLKDGDGDWLRQRTVQLAIRRPGLDPLILKADKWPLPQTEWRNFFLHADTGLLSEQSAHEAAAISYQARHDCAIFETASFDEDQVITGPVAATLWISSDTPDADLFVVVDALDPESHPVDLRDHRTGATAMTVGWLRASHRAMDETRSTPWRPWHPHRHAEPLRPFETYEVRVELRPTSLVLPARHRLRMTIRGVGPAHDDLIDRPAALFDNIVTIHTGLTTPSTLLLPFVQRHFLATEPSEGQV